MKTIFRCTLLLLSAAFLFSCNQAPENDNNNSEKLSGNLTIFHAGSLSVPMKIIADSFMHTYPDVKVLLEADGSVKCARKIIDLQKPCDIMASSDYSVIDSMLIPGYANWNALFAGNEICLVYTEKSRCANEINRDNWFEILQKKEVSYGRSDPNSDPCGYRSVLTMKLSELFYKQKGLTAKLTRKNKEYIRPKEVDLLSLLESQSVDFIFLYRSVAEQHHLKYLILPDSINLKKQELAGLYKQVSIEIRGDKPGKTKTIKGEPMIYGITMLKNAPNKKVAIAFLHYMLCHDKGLKIMKQNGQTIISPAIVKGHDRLPDKLRAITK